MDDSEQRKADYEARVGRLVGHTLASVSYAQGDWGERNEDDWWDSYVPAGHQLDFGVDLQMSTGDTFGIIWDNEFECYGLTVVYHPLRHQVADLLMIDVSTDEHWQPLLGSTIVDVMVAWCWFDDPDGPSYYPQDIEVRFESGRNVWFSAAEREEDSDRLRLIADTVFVVFSPDVAQRYGLGRYAPYLGEA